MNETVQVLTASDDPSKRDELLPHAWDAAAHKYRSIAVHAATTTAPAMGASALQ